MSGAISLLNLFRRKSKAINPEQFFSTDHLASDLKGQTVRSGAVTITTQAGKFVLQTVSTVVVARLLSPEDYGLLGMVTIVTGFANLFSDLGLSAAVVQAPKINQKQVSTLFWIIVSVGVAVAAVVCACSPLVAWFYDEPRLINITLALSANFIFGSLAIQHTALLKRQMRFGIIGQLQILSMVISVATAIVLAYLGFGYWSLVFMQWANLATNAIGVWLACGWRPSLPSRNSNVKSMLTFGTNLTGFRVVNYFTRNLDNLLLGKFWGAEALGLYAKAYQLLLLPVQQISSPMTSVAISALSSLQSQPGKYCDFYYKAVLSITTISMPIMAFMFATSTKLVSILLGERWLDAAVLFRLLMPAAFIGTLYVATGWAYQSLGRTDRQFRIGLINSSITSLVFLISVRWGAAGIAAGFGISQPILFIPSIFYCYKGTPLKVSTLAKNLYRPVVASLGAAAVLLIAQDFLLNEISSVLIGLMLDGLLYLILYLSIWIILPNGKSTLVDVLSAVKSLKRKT